MLAKAQSIQDYVVEIRRKIHQNPELSYQENETAKLVSLHLDELGIRHRTKVARTGVVAEISKNGKDLVDIKSDDDLIKPIIIVRADLDALPLQEENELPFCSRVDGVMHACGHDTHTAMVLGTAKLLKEEDFTGTVRFLFQPAEENAGDDTEAHSGAKRMVMEGVTKDVSAALGLHQIPTMKTGFISIRSDAVMAAGDAFKIQVLGKASHAGATPELGIDAITISAQLINALNTIMSRDVSAHDTAVLSITTIKGGSAINIIADKVTIHGTLRTCKEKTRKKIRDKMKSICRHHGEMHDAEVSLSYLAEIPVTLNDAKVTQMCHESAQKIFSKEKIITLDTVMGTEDFSFIAAAVPSCFVLLGARVPSGEAYSLHNKKMIVNEDAFPLGCAYFAQATLDLLEHYQIND